MEVALKKDGRHKSAHDGERGGVRFANFVSRFEHREWIQREADGNARCGTGQKIPRTR